MQAFVPKTRRPKFDLHLKIIDLNNVPLVTGTCYVKWHLSSSQTAQHRGYTPRAPIRDHKVTWDYMKTLPVRLLVDRGAQLQESEIQFEVLQEYSPGARAERIVLGRLRLNLAEFVDGSHEGVEAVTRRYLMRESKINSTLKVCIYMKQTEGDKNFIAPPLKTAPVFGGIAGIMTGEQGDHDDGGNMPSMSSKAQESGKLQDIYRKTLAASWAAQAGELPADKCIEDIFSGGDGWATKKGAGVSSPKLAGGSAEEDSDGDGRTLRGHQRHPSGSSRRNTIKANQNGGTNSPKIGVVSGRTSIEQQVQSRSDTKQVRYGTTNEIDEFEARDDLRSWEISVHG